MFEFLKALFSGKNKEEDGNMFVIVGLGNPEKKYLQYPMDQEQEVTHSR